MNSISKGQPSMKSRLGLRALLALLLFSALGVPGAANAVEATGGGYMIQPGDVLAIVVWKEEDLKQEVLVRPDGGISFPLAGDIDAAGHTVQDVKQAIVDRIKEYIPEPVVTVLVQKTDGNAIYVLGKVTRPGAFVMQRPLDVTQALAMAGGLATFADENGISILRRAGGSQSALPFRYGDVQKGKSLDQNIMLQPGDVVVVP
ncbi:MAG: polysaccharide biosynthesis/export family protein [Anaerolineae bacterium]|nr:polysaccharide biosynthesis/export family protein [Anaerolineae bacterium]